MAASQFAYVTAITNEFYIPGLKGLCKSLTRVKSKYPLVAIVPSSQPQLRNRILWAFRNYQNFKLIELDGVSVHIDASCNIQRNSHWNDTFFKIQAILLTSYKKIILIDSDMLICRNIDHLFSAENYSAVVAGQSVHPEYKDLNSGLMVIEPNLDLHKRLIGNIASTVKKRNDACAAAGDQDVFISTLSGWSSTPRLKLPEEYNCFFNDIYSVCKKNESKPRNLYVIHFIGSQKPWNDKTIVRKLFWYAKHRRFWQLFFLIKYLWLCGNAQPIRNVCR